MSSTTAQLPTPYNCDPHFARQTESTGLRTQALPLPLVLETSADAECERNEPLE